MDKREQELSKAVADGLYSEHSDVAYLLNIITTLRTEAEQKDKQIYDQGQEICHRNDAANRLVEDLVTLKRVTIPKLEQEAEQAKAKLTEAEHSLRLRAKQHSELIQLYKGLLENSGKLAIQVEHLQSQLATATAGKCGSCEI